MPKTVLSYCFEKGIICHDGCICSNCKNTTEEVIFVSVQESNAIKTNVNATTEATVATI